MQWPSSFFGGCEAVWHSISSSPRQSLPGHAESARVADGKCRETQSRHSPRPLRRRWKWKIRAPSPGIESRLWPKIWTALEKVSCWILFLILLSFIYFILVYLYSWFLPGTMIPNWFLAFVSLGSTIAPRGRKYCRPSFENSLSPSHCHWDGSPNRRPVFLGQTPTEFWAKKIHIFFGSQERPFWSICSLVCPVWNPEVVQNELWQPCLFWKGRLLEDWPMGISFL